MLSFERTAASTPRVQVNRFEYAEYSDMTNAKYYRETKIKLQSNINPGIDFQNDGNNNLSPGEAKMTGKLFWVLIAIIGWIFSKLKGTKNDDQDSTAAEDEFGSDDIAKDH